MIFPTIYLIYAYNWIAGKKDGMKIICRRYIPPSIITRIWKASDGHGIGPSRTLEPVEFVFFGGTEIYFEEILYDLFR